MKLRSWPLLFGLFAGVALHGQIKIGDNPQNIDPSSVLELESSSRVLVITRVSSAEMDAITPIRGAMAYNTDTQCIHYYDGTQWVNLCESLGLTFSTDPVVNAVSGIETIVITQSGSNYNFEIAPNSIKSAQIADGGINGVDIQDNSIGQNKLADDSVGAAELQTNTVTDDEIDYNVVTLNDFTNDVGYITGAQIVSATSGNSITDDGGAFFNAAPLQSAIATNTTNIGNNTQTINQHSTSIANHTAAITQNTSNITANTNAIATKENSANKSNGPLGSSTTLFPTENSVRNAINAAVGGVGGTGNITSSDLVVTGGTNATFNNVTLEIQPSAVGTTELANGSVNNTKLALNAVQTTNILNGTITTADIAPSGPAPAYTQVLTTSTTGSVAWIDLPSGGSGGSQNLNDVLTLGNNGGGLLIKNILDPVDPQDASTKAYVDASSGTGSQNLSQVLTIGSSAGNQRINNLLDPALPQDAATKAYVDANGGGGNQDLTQVLLQGNDAGGVQIENLVDPNDPQDAATQNYVETRIATILGAGGADGVISNAALSGTAIAFTGTNGGFNGNVDLNPVFATDSELATAITTSEGLDLDKDSGNEIQTLSLSGNNLSLSNGGGTVTLTSAGADGVVSNIAVSGTSLNVTGTNGGFNGPLNLEPLVDAAAGNNGYLTTEVDGDPANEIQVLSIAGANLTLSNGGGTVAIPGGANDGVVSNVAVAGTSLNFTGANGGFNGPLNLEPLVDAAAGNNGYLTTEVDGDVSNEIQTLSLIGNNLSLSNGGGNVTLPSGGAVVDTDANDGLTDFNSTSGYDVNVDNVTIEIIGDDLRVKNGGITAAKMAIGSVQGSLGGTSVIISNSIGQGDIGDNAVGAAEIRSDAVSSDEIEDDSIINADINSAAAIAGTKINPNFGSQNIATTGSLDVGGPVNVGGTQVHPDYVFDTYFSGHSDLKGDYKFKTLQEIEAFVKKNHHLPGIKSAAQVKKDGFWNLSESNLKNLEKIEELYLHTIHQEKEINALQKENKTLQQELQELKKEVAAIKNLIKKN
jgi:hypothetical protein